MVQPEQLVIDQAFSKDKSSPPNENCAGKSLTNPQRCPLAHNPVQKKHATDGEQQRPQKKKTILGVLPLELGHRIRLASLGAANHMMPAQNLMKEDAVEKSAQAQAKDDARTNPRSCGRRTQVTSVRRIHAMGMGSQTYLLQWQDS